MIGELTTSKVTRSPLGAGILTWAGAAAAAFSLGAAARASSMADVSSVKALYALGLTRRL